MNDYSQKLLDEIGPKFMTKIAEFTNQHGSKNTLNHVNETHDNISNVSNGKIDGASNTNGKKVKIKKDKSSVKRHDKVKKEHTCGGALHGMAKLTKITKRKRKRKRRGPIIVKYNPKLTGKCKRECGLMKKTREYSIRSGNEVALLIRRPTGEYVVTLTHEDILYNFGFEKISKMIVGNPEIYKFCSKFLKSKSKMSPGIGGEHNPNTVMWEKNPELSNESYLNDKRNAFISQEISEKVRSISTTVALNSVSSNNSSANNNSNSNSNSNITTTTIN